MKIFNFNPAEYTEHYREHGWVHVRNGISPAFLEAARAFISQSFERRKVTGKAIGGTKEQALFEFPPDTDFPDELFEVVAGVAGLHRPTMTLAERHIKAYDHDANPNPLAHKDRFASQCSVGLSIDIPRDSHLVLYPHDHVSRNPFNVSAAYPRSLDEQDRPGPALRGAREIVIDDSAGDVIMFPGASVWHMRRNAASAVNLYLKFNDFGCDPLGEDPASHDVRARTLAAAQSSNGALDSLVPILARRFDTVTRTYTRDWEEVLQANVWDADPVRLSASDDSLLRAIDGRATVAEVIARCGSGREELIRLAVRGVIDLVDRAAPVTSSADSAAAAV